MASKIQLQGLFTIEVDSDLLALVSISTLFLGMHMSDPKSKKQTVKGTTTMTFPLLRDHW